MRNATLILCAGIFLVFSGLSQAEEQKEAGVFATVNGTPLDMNLYQFLLGSREGQSGQMLGYQDDVDVEHHRQQVANDLVMTELLSQKATSLGMHETEMVRAELAMAEKTLLAQLYVKKLMDSIEIDESEIREYYDQQSEQALYRFMIWQTPDEDLAEQTLVALKAGDEVASGDPEVIETPWLRDVDVSPEVQEVVGSMSVDDFADEPVFQDGLWKVFQVIDKQVMQAQSFEEEKEVIKAELVRVKLEEKLDALAEDASIEFKDQSVTQTAR